MMFPVVFVVLVGQYHNVGMCAGVHGVLSTSQIICSIIYSKDFVPV
jgi:sulfite exporter TauE/SafE